MPLPDEFLETLPEEYRDNETLKRFNDPADLAKSYVELRGLQGNSIRIPGKDAPEKDRKEFLESLINRVPEVMFKPNFEDPEQGPEFWRTLGSPEDTDGYENPEDLPTALGDDVEAGLRKAAKDANLTKTQYKKFVEQLAQGLSQSQEAQREAIETENAALKQEWGMTFSERVDAAKKIHEETGLYPDRDFGDLTPKEIKSLYLMHEAMTGKGPQAHRQGDQQTRLMTPEEAKAQAAEIMRRVHDPESDLSQDEKMQLIKKRIDLLTKFAGYSGDINELRA